jgi:hypothetical protein
MAFAAFVLCCLPSSFAESLATPIIDIGAGAYLRGPITVRDPRTNKVILNLPIGAEIKPTPKKRNVYSVRRQDQRRTSLRQD